MPSRSFFFADHASSCSPPGHVCVPSPRMARVSSASVGRRMPRLAAKRLASRQLTKTTGWSAIDSPFSFWTL